MEKRSFYRVYGFKDKLTEGAKLHLEHTVEYDHFYRDVPEMAELTILPEAELVKKRKASVKLEKDISKDIVKGKCKIEFLPFTFLFLQRQPPPLI